jgi:hypothetical protein
MRRALTLLVVLLAMSLIDVRASRAQFVECTPDYIASFAVPEYGWNPGQIDCHEFWRFEFRTPTGPRWIRLIGSHDSARLLPAGGMEAIRSAADRSTDVMRGLGPYLVDDITMLLSRPRSRPDEAQPHGGYASAWTGRADGPEFAACNITLLLGLNDGEVDIVQTVAHEIFHCIQEASLTAAQNQSAAALGEWWSEGSAEEFGAVVARSAGGRLNRVAPFEAEVARRTPLYEMSYEAAVFFFWRNQEYGLPALLPFLRQMAESGDAGSQMAAMARALPYEAWMEFAQAYDDRRIFAPGGGPLTFASQRVDGERWAVASDFSTHTRDLRPFVLELGWTAYQCGGWENSVNSAIEVRREDDPNWAPWPRRLDTEERGNIRYRLAAMVSTSEDLEFNLEAEKRESCTGCLVTRAIDRCVVGTWEQTGGGPMDYIRNIGIPQVTRDAMGKLVLSMSDDGTFVSRGVPIDYQIQIQGNDGDVITSDAFGDIQGTNGRWSAEGGEIAACFDGGGESSATTVTTVRGHTMVIPHSGGGVAGINGAASYTCSDTTLTTSTPMSGGGAMTYTFRRLTRPPRR